METSRYRSSNQQRHRTLSITITYHPGGTRCISLPATFYTQKRHLKIAGHESLFSHLDRICQFCFHYFLTMAKLQYEISLLENKTSLAVQSYQGTVINGVTVLQLLGIDRSDTNRDVTNFATNFRYVLSRSDQVVFSSQLRETWSIPP